MSAVHMIICAATFTVLAKIYSPLLIFLPGEVTPSLDSIGIVVQQHDIGEHKGC